MSVLHTLVPLGLSFLLVAGFLKLAALIYKRTAVKWAHTILFTLLLFLLAAAGKLFVAGLPDFIPPIAQLGFGCMAVTALGGWFFKGRAHSRNGVPFNFARGSALTAIMAGVGMTLSLSTLSAAQYLKETNSNPSAPTDFTAIAVDFSHKPGSTLLAGEYLEVQLKYKFSLPRDPVRIWVKILDPGLDAQYVGYMETLKPGEGEVVRAAYLNSAGKVKNLTVVVKDARSREIYKKDIAVDYTFVDNPEIAARANDGKGSKITGVSFPAGKKATLKKGTFYPVALKYDVNLNEGLYPHATPVTQCSHSFAAVPETEGPIRKKGDVEMGFTVAEACHVKQVKVILVNAVRKTVFEGTIDVDLKYVD
jgi:hypothetical protein